MGPLAIVLAVLFVGGLGLLIRRLISLNSAPTGFAIVASYSTTADANKAAAFLHDQGIHSELDDRRLETSFRPIQGSVHLLVRTADTPRAARAFAALSRGELHIDPPSHKHTQ